MCSAWHSQLFTLVLAAVMQQLRLPPCCALRCRVVSWLSYSSLIAVRQGILIHISGCCLRAVGVAGCSLAKLGLWMVTHVRYALKAIVGLYCGNLTLA
jgi:hypothetical protein